MRRSRRGLTNTPMVTVLRETGTAMLTTERQHLRKLEALLLTDTIHMGRDMGLRLRLPLPFKELQLPEVKKCSG